MNTYYFHPVAKSTVECTFYGSAPQGKTHVVQVPSHVSTEATATVCPPAQSDIPSLGCEVKIAADSSADIQGLDTPSGQIRFPITDLVPANANMPKSNATGNVRRKRGVIMGSKKTSKRKKEEYPCGRCKWNYGDINDPKRNEEWLMCTECLLYYHDSCAQVTGIIDDDEAFTSMECL